MKVLLEYYEKVGDGYEIVASEYCKDYEDAVETWLESEYKYYAIWQLKEELVDEV